MTLQKNNLALKYITFSVVVLSACLLSSCKSKGVFIENKTADLNISTSKIIEKHNSVIKKFTTAYYRTNIKYKDSKQTISFNAEIKQQKKEKILVSIRFLGITMAKGLITPEEVKYYEKNGKSFFEGDYSTLSRWLGASLDYQKVENLLFGRPFINLDTTLSHIVENNLYKISTIDAFQNENIFYFEPTNFFLKKQSINQRDKNQKLEIEYGTYRRLNQEIFPETISIKAIKNEEVTEIFIQLSQITFNEELSFPYSVPEGFNQIFIEE